MPKKKAKATTTTAAEQSASAKSETSATNEQPKPEVQHTAPVSQPEQKKEERVSQQQHAFMALVVGLREQRNIAVTPEMIRQDGKFLVLKINDQWPEIRIGTGGGYDLAAVKSFAKADVPTMCKADELWKKQQEKTAKKTAAAGVPAPAAQQTTTTATA